MNRKIFFAAVITASLITVLLYQPVSLLIFKIREPYFKYPVKTESKNIVIRNDSHGDGYFGAKRRNGRSHDGIDIQVSPGAGIYAAKSGIAFCGNVPAGYGRYIMIYHPDGFQTIYGHLLSWNIPPVKNVRQGELIGFAGKTGNAQNKAIRPHLHFEIRKDGEACDPQGLMR